MVLHGRLCGRVGQRRVNSSKPALGNQSGFFRAKGFPLYIPRIDLGVDSEQLLGNPGVRTIKVRPCAPYPETDDPRLVPFLIRSTNHQRCCRLPLPFPTQPQSPYHPAGPRSPGDQSETAVASENPVPGPARQSDIRVVSDGIIITVVDDPLDTEHLLFVGSQFRPTLEKC